MELRMLTDEERFEAYEQAAEMVRRRAGAKPKPEQFAQRRPVRPRREDFADRNVSRYPESVVRFVGRLLLVVFIAAALPSLFRLFTAGRDYFLHSIDHHWQAALVGFSTFMLAEFLTILSTISARVLFKGIMRIVFVIPIAMGLLVALVGNWTITQPHDAFGWLETVVPPIAVLFVALVGEKIMLDRVQSRYRNERDYQSALVEHEGDVARIEREDEVSYMAALERWEQATAEPESSRHWKPAYANALKEALIVANGRGRGATDRKALMAGLNGAQWAPYIAREWQANAWIEQIDMEAQPVNEQPALVVINPTQAHNGQINPEGSYNGNGAHLTPSGQ